MTDNLRAGAAAVTITPPLGVSLVGSYGDRRADGVLNDLHARALVLGDGQREVAIVVLDLCFIDPSIADRVRSRVAELTGIAAERVMLTCTHTHSAPATAPSAWYDVDQGYTDVLIRRIADAVAFAQGRKQPARLRVGHGREQSISFNRRYWMKDGTLRTNPRFQDPNIVRPAGPIDPEVGLLRVEDTAGRPIALLVNFALHVAVVAGTAFSADYPGVLSDICHKLEGPDVVVMFAIGCCGDINHWDMNRPAPQWGQAEADRIGTILAGEVAKIGARLTPVSGPPRIAYERAVVDLPLRRPSAEELAWARERRGSEMREMDAAGMEVVKAHRVLQVSAWASPTVPAEVQVLTIGDLAYVSLPGEIFVELGLAIKERSPFTHTFISELNATLPAYIPTAKAYGEGGYEVTSSPVEPGSGERLVETALALLEKARA